MAEADIYIYIVVFCFPDLSVVSLPHTNSFLLEVEGQRLEVPFLFRIPDTSNHNLRCLFGDSITSRVPGKSTSGRPCPISITQCSTLSAKSDEAACKLLHVQLWRCFSTFPGSFCNQLKQFDGCQYMYLCVAYLIGWVHSTPLPTFL